MYEHNALGYWSGLALCLTKVRSSRARCPVTALIGHGVVIYYQILLPIFLVYLSNIIDVKCKYWSY